MRSELVKILLNCVIAGMLGYVLAISFGTGLASPPSKVVESFARFENVRLPITARTERELKSFVIRLKDVDDFARVYVNNRQVTSNDDPIRPFRHITWRDKDEDYVKRFAIDRANPINSDVDVRKFLRKGSNWIMVELENSRWGGCSMVLEALANGIQLEGSPYFIPQGEQIDASLSNQLLLQRFRELSVKTSERKEFGVIPEYDALCERLIFAFELH